MTTPADATRADSRTRVPAVLLMLQGAGLLGVAAFYLVEIIAGRSGTVGRAVFGLGLIAAGGLALLLVARGLLRCRRWSHVPALLTQILAIPVAIGLLQGGLWYVGIPLLLWALAIAVWLLRPSTASAFRD